MSTFNLFGAARAMMAFSAILAASGHGAALPYTTDFATSPGPYAVNASIIGQEGWVNLVGSPADSTVREDPTGSGRGQLLSMINGAGTLQYFTNSLDPVEEDIVITYQAYGASASHLRDRTAWFAVNDNADITQVMATISIDAAGRFALNDTHPVLGIMPVTETWYTVTLTLKRASQTLDLTISDGVTTGILTDVPYYQASVTNQLGKLGFNSGVYQSDAVVYVDNVSVSPGPAPVAALTFTNFETSPGPYVANTSVNGQAGWVNLGGSPVNATIVADATGSGRGQMLSLANGAGTQRYFANTLLPMHEDILITYQTYGVSAAHIRDRTSWFSVNDNGAATKLIASVSIDGAGRFALNDTQPVPGILPALGTWYTISLAIRRATQTLDLSITDGVSTGTLTGIPYYQASSTNQLGKVGFISGVYNANAVVYVDNLSVAADFRAYPLPLAAHWTTGVFEEARGWGPDNQLRLIQEDGHHLLPWLQMPQPDNWATFEEALIRADTARNLEAVEEMSDCKLPISFIATEWDAIFSDPAFRNLPADENPNVVTTQGAILEESDPFGPVERWREAGRRWTASEDLESLQAIYPDPPLVVFVTNNERPRLHWKDAEKSRRYVERYGLGRDDAFKRKVVAEGWIERFRALQEGMREGLVSQAWKQNARFVGYEAFGPVHFGRWAGWPDYALSSPGRLDPHPLMWDGASPSYYTDNWNDSTDFKVYSPQIESMNWAFQLRDAWKVNPQFWFELSIWDGYTGGTSSPVTADDKRTYYQNLGQQYSPLRYSGYLQFGMWLLRPRVVREFRMHIHPWEEGKPYFKALLGAVDRVHQNPVLRAWWRDGKLVPNRTRKHPYQTNIPAEFAHEDRWFLLDADCNPQGALQPSTEIPVFALALTKGTAPAREWLIYAHAPLGNRADVTLTIPDYGETTVDVAVGGSFYLVKETENSAQLVAEERGILRLQKVVSRKTHGPAGDLDVPFAVNGGSVEPRGSDACTLIFTFDKELADGLVAVEQGQVGLGEPPSVFGRALTVNLAGVADRQKVTLGLTDVLADDGSSYSGDFSFRILTGDVDGNGMVEAADRLEVQEKMGAYASLENARADVNLSGGMSAADVMMIQQRLTHSVAP